MKDRIEAIANTFVAVPPLVAIVSLGLFVGVLVGSASLGLADDAAVGVATVTLLSFLAAIWIFQTEID